MKDLGTTVHRSEPDLDTLGFADRLRSAELGRFLILALQLALFVVAVRLFRIEEAFGFFDLSVVIAGGFLIHAWLPHRLRMPFFFLLSLVAIWKIFGVVSGLWLVGIALGLIAICHLPIAFWVRVVLVLTAAGVLAAMRAEWIPTTWGSIVVPIVGSMFMFRLAIYLYDIRHEKTPASLWERLSYFFLLPNYCFPLFPVVDYQTFRRTYYDEPAYDIYQKGMLWMYRGVSHLILYRLVYYYMVPSPDDVQHIGGLVQAMLSTYLLYLRLSGQFHLVIGILCLFGFNLPETHHLYYLASSFNDYWRRINIYWKDFMMKMVYYPSFMRLRKIGVVPAIAIATVIVFAGTWILHSYQWFWLQGNFPLTLTDGLFWGILGLLVVVNSVVEAKRTKRRSLTKKAWSFKAATIYSLKVVGMFALICTLWSLWSSARVTEFLSLLAVAGNSSGIQVLLFVLAVVALVGIGVAIQYANHKGWTPYGGAKPTFAGMARTSTIGLIFLVVIGSPTLQNRIGDEAGTFIASLQKEGFNKTDEQLFEHGYYETLLEADKYTSQLWQARMSEPPDWKGVQDTEAVRFVDDVRVYELVPDTVTTLKRAPLATNRWGMRDKYYPKEKSDGTYRIALLGASYVMGAGVADDETFEYILEQRLNDVLEDANYDRIEVLNFAVGGYGLLQQVSVARNQVAAFAPDAILYVVQPGEEERTWYRLIRPVRMQLDLQDDFLRTIVSESGVNPETPRPEFRRRLGAFGGELVKWGYEQLATLARDLGARPVAVFLPSTRRSFEETELDTLSSLARQAGLDVWNLEGVYGTGDPTALVLAPWDNHPNPRGHGLIADRILQNIRSSGNTLGLRLSTRDTTGTEALMPTALE